MSDVYLMLSFALLIAACGFFLREWNRWAERPARPKEFSWRWRWEKSRHSRSIHHVE
jgi:predicted PurR-regulated permease PerM